MRGKGYSFFEILLVMALTFIFVGVIYYGYIFILNKYISSSSKLYVNMSTFIGEEILNQDIEHAGYGISIKEPKPPLEFKIDSNGVPVFTIRSTYVVTNTSTKGWSILDCSSGGSPIPVSYSQWPLPSNQVVLMDFDGNILESYVNINNYTCLSSNYLLAYPVYDITLNAGESFICTHQACAQIDYYLYHSSSVNSACKDMYVLGRRVSWKLKNGIPSGTVIPLLSCVADFQVRIDWGNRQYVNPFDSNDPFYSLIQSAKFEDYMNNLKMIHVYLLVREGKRDPNYVFSGSTKIDNVVLRLPSDYKHYHWKVIKLSVEPINIIRK